MGPGRNQDDCYYYYNAVCSKGYDCPYRHEPAARGVDTVCYYWKTSVCTRPHCGFKHSEPPATVAASATATALQDRRLKQCFWELQPTGCQKLQCPFLHTRQGQVESVAGKLFDAGNIIVNKKKLEALKLILPAESANLQPAQDNKPRRLVVPPGTGGIARRVVTGGIKNRIGKLGEVKKRLGSRGEDLAEGRDKNQDQERNEEKLLRETAIKTIDLRNRIDSKSMSPVQTVRLEYGREERRKEKERRTLKEDRSLKERITLKEGRVKKKSKEKSKPVEKEVPRRVIPRDPNILSSRLFKSRPEIDLPSASDYSDLDTPYGSPDPELITVMSKTTGMYADTSTYSRSAKVRLGKRKVRLSRDESPDSVQELRRAKKKPSSYVAKVLAETRALKNLEPTVVTCRSPSPLQRSPSPLQRSPSPLQRSPSSQERSPSLEPSRSPSPPQRSLSPLQRSPSLEPSRSPSPRRRRMKRSRPDSDLSPPSGDEERTQKKKEKKEKQKEKKEKKIKTKKSKKAKKEEKTEKKKSKKSAKVEKGRRDRKVGSAGSPRSEDEVEDGLEDPSHRPEDGADNPEVNQEAGEGAGEPRDDAPNHEDDVLQQLDEFINN